MIKKLITTIKEWLGLSNGYYDKHYQEMDKQPIERMQETLTLEEFIGYLKGNIIKYTLRAGRKAGEPYDKDIIKKRRYEYWLSLAEKGIKIDPRK